MKVNLFILFITIFSVNAVELPFYEAKYKFESDEINITGIRKFNKNSKGYVIEFQASNLIVGMNFSSLFHFEDYKVIPKSYDVKIKPKFLLVSICSFLLSKSSANCKIFSKSF